MSELSELEKSENTEKKIRIEKLSVSYGKKNIFSNVNLVLAGGEFACLCGANGSGKSTLLSAISGIDVNGICIDGGGEDFLRLKNFSRKELAHKIAFMRQSEFSVWDFTVRELVLQGRFSYTKAGNYSKEDYEITDKTLEQLGMKNLADRNVHQLSGGEFQKVRIARALCQNPDFILLDEPAAQLDFVYEPKLMEFLKKQSHEKNIGILISIHDVNVAARFADKIHLLTKTGLISGTAEQVFTEENLEKSFGTKCRIYEHPMYNCLQIMTLEN